MSFVERHRRLSVIALLVALLAFESVWFFHGHYRGTAAFPFDFSQSYHAVPFYWHGAIRAGEFPAWLPYQAFGYPISLNLQSGLFYPPLWLFPIFGLVYSTKAAAVLQCLHIAFGGAGAFAFARARKLELPVAFVCAVAFGVFGGCFSNAQHVDIVRGYALTPWLFAALTLGEGTRVRAWFVAPLVFLMMTGAYPGQSMAVLPFGFAYLAMQIAEARLERRPIVLRPALICAAALVLGLAASAVSVLPGWLMRSEISRIDEVGKLTVTGLGFDHLFTTVFTYDSSSLSGDISMRSLFVTVPVLLGVFLVKRGDLKRHASLVAIALAAFAMSCGGVVFGLVGKIVPLLGLSRFPAADYRALVALPMLLLGAHGLCTAVVARDVSWRRLAIGAAGFLAFVVLGWERLHPTALGAVSIVIIGSLGLVAMARGVQRVPTAALLVALFALLLFDADRMHEAVRDPWATTADRTPFKRYSRELSTQIATPLERRPARAPARYQTDHLAPDLDGYLRGHYTGDDYSSSEHFRAVIAIREAPELTTYMMQESTPKVVRATSTALAAATRPSELGDARAVRVTTAEIEYRVSATADAVLVENEPSFEGWSGYLDCGTDGQRPITELWPLRGWRIPVGEHRFCARYTTPGLRAGATISIAALLAWLAWAAWLVAHRRR